MEASPDWRRGGIAPVAAFDFDGTLTCRDSFVAFLQWRVGRTAFLAGLPALVPDALVYLVRRDRGALKAAAAKRCIWIRLPVQLQWRCASLPLAAALVPLCR